jgi:hypothetical protein
MFATVILRKIFSMIAWLEYELITENNTKRYFGRKWKWTV